MPLGNYDTATLIRVIDSFAPDLTNYWSQFFPNEITFAQEKIDFDMLSDEVKDLAPFVAPTVQGKVLKDIGFNMKSFAPAYLKPKSIIDPSKLVKRRAGESRGGSLSLDQRHSLTVTAILERQKRAIDRRIEWMAARALIDGAVTVAGDDYPTQTVDFGRDAGHTITLTGTDLWTDTVNSDPVDDVETWANLIFLKTGRTVNRATMGLNVWKAFRKHPKTQDLLDLNYKGSITSFTRDPVLDTNAQKVGNLGAIELWIYNDTYHNDAGVATSMMDQNHIVLTSAGGIDGYQCFGGIMDARAGWQALRYFSKTWMQEDPSVEYLMTQSAPLMVPLRANGSLRAKAV